ncbi:hypothetical protein [Amycolatopsis nigrescens]|uniref:hypothetical protein n=1 Tax=Amycolatopsis nigrescens TaxID=381445 RepID=UPI00037CED76|nr:hypothetical protein [Amycolatopsis nigrescens]
MAEASEVERDPAALSASEDLDEDRLQADPLEEGVEPPERWTAADGYGMTPAEQRAGESLDRKLAEEQPDVRPEDVPERPIAATPAQELDESVDDAPPDAEEVAPDERLDGPRSSDVVRGQNADVAGGSVAETIRTPE